jgi:hypothetical protein
MTNKKMMINAVYGGKKRREFLELRRIFLRRCTCVSGR